MSSASDSLLMLSDVRCTNSNYATTDVRATRWRTAEQVDHRSVLPDCWSVSSVHVDCVLVVPSQMDFLTGNEVHLLWTRDSSPLSV